MRRDGTLTTYYGIFECVITNSLWYLYVDTLQVCDRYNHWLKIQMSCIHFFSQLCFQHIESRYPFFSYNVMQAYLDYRGLWRELIFIVNISIRVGNNVRIFFWKSLGLRLPSGKLYKLYQNTIVWVWLLHFFVSLYIILRNTICFFSNLHVVLSYLVSFPFDFMSHLIDGYKVSYIV